MRGTPAAGARLRHHRIKADEATIARSLQGHWRKEHIFKLTQALELYRFYQDKIGECDREIEAQLERFEDRSDGQPPAPNGKKRNQKNAPRFDVQSQLYRMTGVDLAVVFQPSLGRPFSRTSGHLGKRGVVTNIRLLLAGQSPPLASSKARCGDNLSRLRMSS